MRASVRACVRASVFVVCVLVCVLVCVCLYVRVCARKYICSKKDDESTAITAETEIYVILAGKAT